MEKKRRANAMEEAKKELKIEGIEEIREKAAEKADLIVRDYVNMTRELTGLIRENYIMSLQLFFSLWEENLKIINRRTEEWMRLQEESTKLTKEPFGRFPTEMFNFWSGNSKFINSHVEKIIAFQRDYSQTVMNTSDKLMKETLGLMKNGIDRVFSSFSEHIRVD
jgi:hypothetical protein